MNISCSTSAFKIGLEKALEKVGTLGFSHADIIAIKGWGAVEIEYLNEKREEYISTIKRSIVMPSAFNASFGNLHIRDDEVVKNRLQDVQKLSSLMKEVGVKLSSFYPGFKQDTLDWREVAEDSMKSIEEIYKTGIEEGVVFAVEPHFNTPFQRLEEVDTLLSSISVPITYDPSHFIMQGIDIKKTEKYLERSAHIHVRDASLDKMQRKTGKGDLNIKDFCTMVKAFGYNGFISIEYLPNLGEGFVEDSILKMKDLLLENLS